MKLKYKILWLDDKINEFIDEEFVEEIEKHLTENGFVPEITTVSNSEEFFNKLNNSYDLILTDYHLNDENGDEVVEKIRSPIFSVMTEILFYTARADLKDTQKISRVSFLETKSSIDDHKDTVVKKTIELINLTIIKFQNIVAMRGMIMHETSSLDVQIEQTLLKLLTKNNSDAEISISKIKSKFINSSNEFNKRLENLTDNDLISCIGATHRWRAIMRNIDTGNCKTIFCDYDKEIISIRNKFAHAILEIDENGVEYFENKNENLLFDQELCKIIRLNINKHKKNLDEINNDFT